MAINGTAVGVASVGVILAYSGIRGKSISNTLRYVISGKNPADSPDTAATFVLPENASASDPGTYAPPTGGGSGNQYAHILAYVRKQFPRYATAGILGNMSVETGGTFDPTSFNVSEGAIGICQWEKGRRTALQAYAKLNGKTETDIDAQLGYMTLELSSAYAPVRLQLLGATSPSVAAKIFDVGLGGAHSGTGFENSSGDATQERMNRAEAIYATIK